MTMEPLVSTSTSILSSVSVEMVSLESLVWKVHRLFHNTTYRKTRVFKHVFVFTLYLLFCSLLAIKGCEWGVNVNLSIG